MDKSTIFSGSLTITENLEVLGTASYIHTEDLKIKDKNVEVGEGILSKELLDGAGVTFGVESLGVDLKYSSEKDKFIPGVPVQTKWEDLEDVPEHKRITFTPGKFDENLEYSPTGSEDIVVNIPTRPEHIGAPGTGSFEEFSERVVKLEETSSKLTVTSSVFSGRLNRIEQATASINSDLETLNNFKNNTTPLIDYPGKTFLGSASYAKEVSWENVSKHPEFISASWTESKSSQFSGTASYALSASIAKDYLPLSGGILSGKLTIKSTLENGSDNVAEGYYSHAEGAGTIAKAESSHAEGRNTRAEAVGSHAEGQETIASGLYSHAEGYKTVAVGKYQHVSGKYNLTGSQYNDYLFIIGNGDYIEASSSRPAYESRSNAFAVDKNGNIEIPEGAEIKGTASYALVAETVKSGGGLTVDSASHAAEVQWTGVTNRPSSLPASDVYEWAKAPSKPSYTPSEIGAAEESHNHDDRYLQLSGGDINGNVHITGSLTNGGSTNGQYVKAEGRYSHAEGAGSISKGESSHAEGRETIASGDYSHAEGYSSEAQGLYSHAEGDHTIATQENQLVIGQYNDTSSISDKLFVIGNGSYESSQSYQPSVRSNAFTVDKWGNIDIPKQSMLRGTASYAVTAENVQYTINNLCQVLRSKGIDIDVTWDSNGIGQFS